MDVLFQLTMPPIDEELWYRIVRIGTASLLIPMLLHTWANTAPYLL